jgi:hypothetical protein
MPSAPVPVINVSSGVVTWTNPATPPASWILEIRYPDKSTSTFFEQGQQLSGSTTSFDLVANGWPGGFFVALTGIDTDDNVVYSTVDSISLSKNIT